MKKTVKKLILHRETLQRLNGEALAAVDGGAPTREFQSCVVSCPVSYNTNCTACL